MKFHYALLVPVLLQFGPAVGQVFPPEWHFSSDGHQLNIGGQPVEGFYDLSVIRNIELQFSQPNYWDLMTVNQATNTRIPATLIVDGVQFDSVGVRFKGSTSEEIETTQKRSFNIDLNFYIPGQNVMGYSSIILDNASNDPSFLREVVFSELIRDHVPTSKANFAHLSINGESWGLYPNIQDLNSPFLREWFFSNNGSIWRAERPDGQEIGAWGDGTAALNWLGPDTTAYQTYYDLERTEQVQPWDALVKVIDKLNNTPLATLEDSLNKYMDVDRALWFLAAENAFSDRSSYTRKGKDDYFIYYEPESGRTSMIEFDGRATMRANMVNWTPFYNADDSNYPLLHRSLSISSLRQRYLAHLRTLIDEKMQSPAFNALVDDLVALIDAEVQADPRKLYTYAEFLVEVQELKDFITTRRNTLNANFEVAMQGPSISQVDHRVNDVAWVDPLANETVDVRATVSSSNGISDVALYYSPGLFAPFQRLAMHDDGMHNDGAAGDGIFGATIPALPPLTQVRYYIAAAAQNASATVSYEPAGAEHKVYTYLVQHPSAVDPPVRINEVMAWNTWVVHDAFFEYDDWIELYNVTDQTVDLSGHYLSDNGQQLQKWQFPLGSVIPPFGFKIIWADNQPEQGEDHADFALNNNGESVWLSNAQGVILDHVIFGPQIVNIAYARRPNGTGPFEYQEATFGIDNDMVSVPELDAADLLRMFPNPANTQLTMISEEPLDIVVHDALMRQVFSGRIHGRMDLDISDWSAGTYHLRHQGGVRKLVVIH